MNRLFGLLTIVVAIALAVAPARAETWVVGSQEGFGPFNYTVDGRYSGMDVDILEEAAAMIGVTLDHRPGPWKRALFDFEAGKLDAMFQLTPTPERFEKWNMVGPFRTTRTVYVTRKDSPIVDIRSLEDLEGLVIGVVSGFTYGSAFDVQDDLIKEESTDDFTNVRKLLLGRSDVIVGGNATLDYVADELNAQDKLRVLPTPLVERDRYIAFHRSPRGDDQARRMQAALDRMHSSGRILEIVKKHLEK